MTWRIFEIFSLTFPGSPWLFKILISPGFPGSPGLSEPYETPFNKSKDLYSNTLVESGFKYKITFQKQQNTATVTNNTKNRKRKIIWFNSPFSLFQQISVKYFLVYWANNSQRRFSYINCSTVEQWNLSKADTYGTEVFVRFREVSAFERFELKSSQI